MFYLYVRDRLHLAIPSQEATFDTQQNLESHGFQLIWDSAPSEFKAAQYAAEFYGAPVPVHRAQLNA